MESPGPQGDFPHPFPEQKHTWLSFCFRRISTWQDGRDQKKRVSFLLIINISYIQNILGFLGVYGCWFPMISPKSHVRDFNSSSSTWFNIYIVIYIYVCNWIDPTRSGIFGKWHEKKETPWHIPWEHLINVAKLGVLAVWYWGEGLRFHMIHQNILMLITIILRQEQGMCFTIDHHYFLWKSK